MRRLILRDRFSPGDSVLLTAAVRDLHFHNPGKFVTDVRSLCPAIWEHNPFITELSDAAGGVELLDCHYPLINQANRLPYHAIHGYAQFLSAHLKVPVVPTAFKGDIYLSREERAWYSQVHEYGGIDLPFWIVVAGGKHDITVKWWATERYQKVIDHFRNKILFVQVGNRSHHHPKLEGVVDLRGRTTLREFIRLVHHADGVLCPVTAAMHLAAAVPGKHGQERPCVVVAGGREPVHWEHYPFHQFIHMVGALPCSVSGGCWRDRVFPLRDGDPRDGTRHVCLMPRDGMPRCLDLISSDEVIAAIEKYFIGGVLEYLRPRHLPSVRRAIKTTYENDFDNEPLSLASAGYACDRFVSTELPRTHISQWIGRGIVMCAGGIRQFVNAWSAINVLRDVGCRLPIEVWYLGQEELSKAQRKLLEPKGVRCIDAQQVRTKYPVRRLGGWELKPYSILNSSFREVLFMDSDNVVVRDPEYLFANEHFVRTGAVFWPDRSRFRKANPIWRSCGLAVPLEPEFESGQMLVDKGRVWRGLALAVWFNSHSDFYYRYLHGDKETYHLAFRKLDLPYTLIGTPLELRGPVFIQHDFNGKPLFQHRTRDKWNVFLSNPRFPWFHHDERCRKHIADLRSKLTWSRQRIARFTRPSGQTRKVVISAAVFGAHSSEKPFTNTHWPEHLPVRTKPTFIEAVVEALTGRAEYVFTVRSGTKLCTHIYHNLCIWPPVRNRSLEIATLDTYNLVELACDIETGTEEVSLSSFVSLSACLLSRNAAARLVKDWPELGGSDIERLRRWCSRSRVALLAHVPSLAQSPSRHARAWDFNKRWCASQFLSGYGKGRMGKRGGTRIRCLESKPCNATSLVEPLPVTAAREPARRASGD